MNYQQQLERFEEAQAGLDNLIKEFGPTFPTRKIAKRIYAYSEMGRTTLIFRMQKKKKYHYQTLGELDEQLSLNEAVSQSFAYEHQVKTNGVIDNYIYQLQEHRRSLETIDDLAYDWFIASEALFDITEPVPLKNMARYQNFYYRHMQPTVGSVAIRNFEGSLVEVMVKNIKAKAEGTPFTYDATGKIAKDILSILLKRARRYRLTDINVAKLFTARETGYINTSSNSALKDHELLYLIRCLEKERATSHANVNLVYLLLILGPRKGDLIKAQYQDFGHSEQYFNDNGEPDLVWNLTAEKNDIERSIYLTPFVQGLLTELLELEDESDYLFPARKSDSSSPYLSLSTPNKFVKRIAPDLDREIHELRHTCRTLLSVLEIPDDVAESYILHSKKLYRHDPEHLYPARKQASIAMSDRIELFIAEARLINFIEELNQEKKSA